MVRVPMRMTAPCFRWPPCIASRRCRTLAATLRLTPRRCSPHSLFNSNGTLSHGLSVQCFAQSGSCRPLPVKQAAEAVLSRALL